MLKIPLAAMFTFKLLGFWGYFVVFPLLCIPFSHPTLCIFFFSFWCFNEIFFWDCVNETLLWINMYWYSITKVRKRKKEYWFTCYESVIGFDVIFENTIETDMNLQQKLLWWKSELSKRINCIEFHSYSNHRFKVKLWHMLSIKM